MTALRDQLARARGAYVAGAVPSLVEAARCVGLRDDVVVAAAGRERWTLERHVHLGPTLTLAGPPCCADGVYCGRCREACARAGVIDLAAVRAAREDR